MKPKKPVHPTPAGQRGSALVLALLLSAALVTLGGTYLVMSFNDRTIAANRADGSRAFHLADAGIERAIAELPTRDFDALLGGGGVLFNNQSLGDGVYTVTVANNIAPDFPTGAIAADGGGALNDTDGFLVVNSVGTFQGSERGVQIIVRFVPALPAPWAFPYAAFGRTSLTATGGVPSSEFYGAVGTNGNMTFSGGGPKVWGNAMAMGTINQPSWVTGTVTVGAPVVATPIVACPVQAWGPAPTGTYTLSGTGKLTINSADVVFNSGTYYFSEISKSGGGNISIAAGANVQIFVSGKIAMSGGGWVNPSASALNLQFWGCGATAATWTITGPQMSWFTMYAPTRTITFTGGGDKYGSFIGSSFSNSGPGDVHWDATLEPPPNIPFTVVDGTWTEL